MKSRFTLLSAALATVFLASACNQTQAPSGGAAAETSPVVAKVNGTEIRQSQINAILAKVPNLPPERIKEASKQILDKLVDEELVVQLALGKKLDADPKIAQSLSAARNQILIQAYLDQATSNLPKPSDAEVKDFYDKNPALFKQRKVYTLRELSLPARPELAPQLDAAVQKAKSLEEVGLWLKNQKQPFNVSAATKPAEQLPQELLPKFAALGDGKMLLVNAGANYLVVQVMGSRVQPVDETAARPVIERFLTTQKRAEAAGKEIKSQREKAKIELVGEAGSTPPARPN